MPKNKKTRYFGIVKIRTDEKFCWISKEDKNGWSLGFALNKRDVWLRGLRFSSRKEVERALKSNIVFVHLKTSKEVIE